MALIPLVERTIWITGASTGIGNNLAKQLLSKGNKLILTSRKAASLEPLRARYPQQVHILAADISNSNSTKIMTQGLAALVKSIDTIILNAGTCEYVETNTFESAMFDRVFQVNMMGMARCLEAALPLLRTSDKSPHIVGISSAAALTGLPRAEAYGASKAAVINCLESLALDLHEQKIAVSIVYPGFVDTPLTQRNDFPMPFLMSPEAATKCIIAGIEKRKFRISFPLRLIWLLKAIAALPDSLRHRIGLAMVRKPL